MTTAAERTSSPSDTAVPPAGHAPVAAPAAGYVGTLIALLVLGLGVVALRDAAVSASWLDGRPFLTSAIGWIDGLGFDWWMIPVGIVAIVIGAWWVYAALRPRRRTTVAVTARSSVWIAPADLARLASLAAEAVPGVVDARTSATRRKITVTAHTTSDGANPTLEAELTEAVRAATAIVATPPKIRIRTRAGDR